MPRALGMAGEASGRAFRGGGEGTGEGRGDRVARRGEPPRERRARDDRRGDEGRPRGGGATSRVAGGRARATPGGGGAGRPRKALVGAQYRPRRPPGDG